MSDFYKFDPVEANKIRQFIIQPRRQNKGIPMKLPIGTNGQTTVNELIAALLDFPPGAIIKIRTEHPNAQGELIAVVGTEETVVMDTWE